MSKFWFFTVLVFLAMLPMRRAQGTQTQSTQAQNTQAQNTQAQNGGANVIMAGFHRSPWFGEQIREQWIEPGVRAILNAPAQLDATYPTRLIVYTTPNGNTIEQTLGSALTQGTDWHFDIQHIAAQTRRLRELSPNENIVLACLEAEGLSWPAWRQSHPDNATLIRSVVETLKAQIPSEQPVKVTLSGHSGGGSFIFGYLNSSPTIPDDIDRIAFLDANYAYNDAEDHHGDKLLAWLKANPSHQIVVIAYNDRNITLDGKKVVSETGGTFRASERMKTRFAEENTLSSSTANDITTTEGMNGRIWFRVHQNPNNKILHTVLVGEMNGFLEAMTHGTPQIADWGTFGTTGRAYTKWIQPVAAIPARPVDAMGGKAFIAKIKDLSPTEREEAIAIEICRGNIPNFLRAFQTIVTSATDKDGKEHTATYKVAPDYLAVGSDTDFVRLPMTPQTAQRIADAFGCSLPTRKMVNDIYAQATVKLEPHPLTEAREAVTSFAQHSAIIETQRAGKPLGALVAGNQKDVVVTNRLGEKPNRVAIYGWHKLDVNPIQPLTIVHRDTYVDYSHGIRLVKRTVQVDGRTRDLHLALHSPVYSPLFSDEGPIMYPSY